MQGPRAARACTPLPHPPTPSFPPVGRPQGHTWLPQSAISLRGGRMACPLGAAWRSMGQHAMCSAGVEAGGRYIDGAAAFQFLPLQSPPCSHASGVQLPQRRPPNREWGKTRGGPNAWRGGPNAWRGTTKPGCHELQDLYQLAGRTDWPATAGTKKGWRRRVRGTTARTVGRGPSGIRPSSLQPQEALLTNPVRGACHPQHLHPRSAGPPSVSLTTTSSS